ncbi:MAG: RNHCP domain-containing protein [Candidatus Peregrinibacteria bacterium]
MSFVVINDGFDCMNCGEENPPAPKTCRNHCRKCLCSCHVDAVFPGDRESECHGLMPVVEVFSDAQKDFVLVHRCQKCHKEIRNKVAEDDDTEEIFRILPGIRHS